MIYPIVAYGNPVLKKEAEELPEGSDLTQLIQDMYATMDHAHGVGLAAPQINQGVRLFVIDINEVYQQAIKLFGEADKIASAKTL